MDYCSFAITVPRGRRFSVGDAAGNINNLLDYWSQSTSISVQISSGRRDSWFIFAAVKHRPSGERMMT